MLGVDAYYPLNVSATGGGPPDLMQYWPQNMTVCVDTIVCVVLCVGLRGDVFLLGGCKGDSSAYARWNNCSEVFCP